MLTCFDLKPEFSIEEFEQSLADYTEHMHKLDLIESNGPIGLRQSDTIMDTDDERKQSTSKGASIFMKCSGQVTPSIKKFTRKCKIRFSFAGRIGKED